MSLHIEVLINSDRIGSLTVWRESNTPVGSVHEYVWQLMDKDRLVETGSVFHNPADGAFALAAVVLSLLAAGQRGADRVEVIV